jgi:hypothetical protein
LVGVLKYLVLGVFFVFFLFWFWLGWGAIGIFLCVAEGTQGQNNTPYFHRRFLFIYLFIYFYFYYLFLKLGVTWKLNRGENTFVTLSDKRMAAYGMEDGASERVSQ